MQTEQPHQEVGSARPSGSAPHNLELKDARALRSEPAKVRSSKPVTFGTEPKRTGLGQRTCLDGIRGAALLGVIIFHLDYGWASAGYFGVDIFFVLSGFLITSLLLHEFLKVGHINLASFWSRRARRLLPALLLTLAVVAVLGRLTLPTEDLGPLRRDGFAALTYVSNWVRASSGSNYFDLFATRSLLEHFWTLAIEEQFYLVWPLLAAALFAWSSRRSTTMRPTVRYGHPLIAVGFLGAFASAAWMAYLYQSRGSKIVGALYFRTDTRAQAILIGVGFAGVVARLGRVDDREHRRWWDRAGIAAAIGLLAVVAWQPGDGFQYQGIFLLVAVLAGVLIASPMLAPDGLLNRALNNRTLRYLGTLSYGLYLWHWPIFQVLTPERTGLPWLVNDVLRLAATFAAAEASARLVETPVRKGTFPLQGTRTAFLSMGAVAALIYVATMGATLTDAQRYQRDQQYAAAPPVATPKATQALVVGDAFGASIGTNWSGDSGAAKNLVVTNIADAACTLAATCPQAPAQWLETAKSTKPDVVVIALTSWVTFDTSNASSEVDFSGLRKLVSQITALVDQFKALGIHMVAVTPVPDGATGPTSIATTQQAFDESQQATSGWLVSNFPKADACPQGTCVPPAGSASAEYALPPTFLSELTEKVRQVHSEAANGSGSSDKRLRVLIVGDSVAWSLGSGWYEGSSRPPADADVLIWNRGAFFCGIDDLPGYELNGDRREGSACPDWRTTWKADLGTFDPDIVLLPASVWTTLDRVIDGERVAWESPQYQERLKALYTEAGMLLSSTGARVGFLSEAPNHIVALNESKNAVQASRAKTQSLMVQQIAAEHPDKFTFIDYAGFVCPDGDCEKKVNGVELRPDDLHLSAKGSAIVADWLEPQLVALVPAKGSASGAASSTTSPGLTAPGSTTAPATTITGAGASTG